MYLPIDMFKNIIEYTPLISIDLVVVNGADEILLGWRSNRPAKDSWFVPGGRIQKNETMDNAFKRLTLNELGMEFQLHQAELIGPFEHFYEDNVTGDDYNTHYIALGYKLLVDNIKLKLPTEQHSKYTWMNTDDLLSNSKVHRHSRWYFDSSAQ